MSVALFGGNEVLIVGDVSADAKTAEYHTFAATPTNFAVESGSVAADHIIEMPDALEVAFTITSFDEGGFGSYGTRAATRLDALHARIKERALWQVVTRHKLYESVAIIGIRAEHVSPFTGALRGRIAFQEIPRVTLERVQLPETRTKKTAASKTNAGRVETKEPTAAETGRANDSVFSQMSKR